jgi:hypothetical protein
MLSQHFVMHVVPPLGATCARKHQLHNHLVLALGLLANHVHWSHMRERRCKNDYSSCLGNTPVTEIKAEIDIPMVGLGHQGHIISYREGGMQLIQTLKCYYF